MPLPGELADLADEVRNWGRWGDADELGCGALSDSQFHCQFPSSIQQVCARWFLGLHIVLLYRHRIASSGRRPSALT